MEKPTVFIVVREDRHTDVDVEVFTEKVAAIARARAIMAEYDDAEERAIRPTNDWIFDAQLTEGDYVRVEKVELQ